MDTAANLLLVRLAREYSESRTKDAHKKLTVDFVLKLVLSYFVIFRDYIT